MSIKIKGWTKFQHFKDRRPPWIKLYRDILEDPDWHELDGETAKTLVSLWLIASEDNKQQGTLPDFRHLAFRLRTSETKIKQAVFKLSHWLEQDASNMISTRYQDDAPETETETEKETETEERQRVRDDDFDEFWKDYPKKSGKEQARKAWAKLNPPLNAVLNALAWQKDSQQWRRENGQFIPMPATYLNQRRWEDEPTDVKPFNKQIALEQMNHRVMEDWLAKNGTVEG